MTGQRGWAEFPPSDLLNGLVGKKRKKKATPEFLRSRCGQKSTASGCGAAAQPTSCPRSADRPAQPLSASGEPCVTARPRRRSGFSRSSDWSVPGGTNKHVKPSSVPENASLTRTRVEFLALEFRAKTASWWCWGGKLVKRQRICKEIHFHLLILRLTPNPSRVFATQLSPARLHAAFDCRAGESSNFAPDSQLSGASAAFWAC